MASTTYAGLPSGVTVSPIGAINYGTIDQQRQRRRDVEVQTPYENAQPSPKTAGGAAIGAANISSGTGAGYAVDPYGYTRYNDEAQQERTTLELQAKLQADAEARRLQSLRELAAQYGGSQTPLPPRVQHDPSGAEDAARAAAFARAKDQTGALAASQMRSVGDIMAARGVAGSPIEGLKMAGVLGGARGNLDNVVAEQLIQDLNRAREVSDLTYTGNITQRGQDINQPNNQMKLAMLGLFSQLF